MSEMRPGTSKWVSRARVAAAPGAGAMTAAMRAMATQSARVLRIAVVRNGAIVEERVLRDRSMVTCGSSERCMFVVNGASAPERHALFEIVGGRYRVNTLACMSGKIALAYSVVDIATLVAGGARAIELHDDARGKLVVGDTSIIFQHVDAPIEARPKLPLSVRRGLGIDWNLTVIAAFSFLVHFGVVGASYSDFADPVHDEESVVGVLDQLKNLPLADVETTSPVDRADPTPDPKRATNEKQAPKSTTGASGVNAPPPRSTGVSVSEAEQARLGILLAYGNGQRVAVLDPRAPMLPPGVWIDRPGIRRDPNAPIATPDAPIAIGTPDPAPTTMIKVEPPGIAIKTPPLPPVIVNPEPPIGAVDPSPVAALGPRARYCYQQALLKNPNQQGRLVITLRVGPSGDVQSAGIMSSNGLDASVGRCVLGGASGLHFKSPGASGGQLNVPFTFIKQ